VTILSALSRTNATLNQAQFVTDLYVQPVNGNQVLSLCWYARVPLLGNIISYIRYYLCDGTPMQAAALELLGNYQLDLNKDVAKVLKEESRAEEVYQASLKLNACFDRFAALTTQPSLNKSLNYTAFFPTAVPRPEGDISTALRALCVRVDNLKKAMNFETQLQDTTFHAHLVNALQEIETAFKNALGNFIKEGALNEDLAITQMGTIHQDLVAVRSRLGIAPDPSQDWLEMGNTTWGNRARGTVDESELKVAFRMGKLASHILAWENLRRSLHPHLCKFVEEYRPRFKASVDDFCSQGGDLKKIKRSYQTIEAIISQTSDIEEALKMPRKAKRLLFELENLVAASTFSQAKSTLRKCFENRDVLKVMDRLQQLIEEIQPKLLGPSRPIAARVLNIATQYRSLLEKEKKIGKTIPELTMHVKQLQTDVDQLTEIKRYDKAEETLLQIQRYHKQIAAVAPFASHLMRYLTAVLLDLQKKCDFASFTEQDQETVVQQMTYQAMTALLKKHPRVAHIVEKVLARRTPQVMVSLLQSLYQQLVTYSSQLENQIQQKRDEEKMASVKEKLLQMELEAQTQVPPQNLEQTLDYLHKQQEALVLVLALAPPTFIDSIQLPCTSFYIEGKAIGRFDSKKIDSDCRCSIHQNLKKSYLLSHYFALEHDPQGFDFKTLEVKKIFDILLELDLVKAANFLLLLPIHENDMRTIATPLILQLREITVQGGEPFAKLGSYPQKQKLLSLAARLLPDTDAAEFAHEVNLSSFQGNSWEKIDKTIISSFTFDPQTRYTPETVQLRDAVGWIMGNRYFQQKYPALAANSQKLYWQLAPNILDSLPQEIFNQIFGYLHNEEVKAVSKIWNACFATSVAALVPHRFANFVDHLHKQLEEKAEDQLAELRESNIFVLEDLEKIKKKKVEKLPSTVEESKLYVNEQLQDVVKILAKLPPYITKRRVDLARCNTRYILFGRLSSKFPSTCMVLKSFRESRAWHWYHASIEGSTNNPYDSPFGKKAKNYLLLIAEKNPEAVLDWIVKYERERTDYWEWKRKDFLIGLVQLSHEKKPQSEDPFAIFQNSAKKDGFLRKNLVSRQVGFYLNKFAIPAAIESIQDVTIKKEVLFFFALTLLKEGNFAPRFIEAKEAPCNDEALFYSLCWKIHNLGSEAESQFIAKVALEIGADASTRAGRSAVQVATTIPDEAIREETLYQLVRPLFQSSKNLPDIIQAFEFLKNRSSLGQEMVNFINQKMAELENPRMLLQYITDEPLRKTAETLINLKFKPVVSN
jgi:hypothetical protein